MIEDINIVGITRIEDYPNSKYLKSHKENITNMNLPMASHKPEIESINEVSIKLNISKYKKIKTIFGTKILVTISASVKVMYIGNNLQQSVHSSQWEIEICDFISLENMEYELIEICKNDLFMGVEDICVVNFNNNSICISLAYILCFYMKENYKPIINTCKESAYCAQYNKTYIKNTYGNNW